MESKYDIVVATDVNYIIHTLALMASVGTNENDSTCFHILSFNMTDEDKRKFEVVPSRFSQIQYKFYDLNDDILKERLFSGVEVSRDRSLAAYARLLIPDLLPKNIHRCIYMDVDALVLGSLKEYYDIDFGDYSLAGVRDTNPIIRHRNVGLKDDDLYINSGLIVWNLDACREKKLIDVMRSFIKQYNGQIDAMDQGTINGALSHQIMELHPKFNVLTSFFQLNSKEITSYYKINTYTDIEILEARRTPLFVHFTPNLTTRPWIKNCKHPLVGEYWKYRNMISQKSVPSDDCRSFKMKMLSRLFYINHALYFNLIKLLR